MSKKSICAPRTRDAYSISQNFLTSARTIDRLLSLTNITSADAVWEIGAGKGHITRRLLGRCGRVTAVEIDPALHRKLCERLGDAQNLQLLHGDFLRLRLPRTTPYKVFANIPFSRTSEILRRLTEGPNPPQECWLIMEKGAAKRFAGLPQETLASLSLKPFFDVRIVHRLRREDFHPAPSVDVVLLHLCRRHAPDIAAGSRKMWQGFVRAMQPCLGGRGRGPMTRHQVSCALRHAGIAEIPQSATLSYVQWLCLFRWWARLVPATPCRK